MMSQNETQMFEAPPGEHRCFLLDPNDLGKKLDIEKAEPEYLFAAMIESGEIDPDQKKRLDERLLGFLPSENGWSQFSTWFEELFIKTEGKTSALDDDVHAKIFSRCPAMSMLRRFPNPYSIYGMRGKVIALGDEDEEFVELDLGDSTRTPILPVHAFRTSINIKDWEMAPFPSSRLDKSLRNARFSLERQIVKSVLSMIQRVAIDYGELQQLDDRGLVICHPSEYDYVIEQSSLSPVLSTMLPKRRLLVLPEGRATGCIQISKGSVTPEWTPNRCSLHIEIGLKCAVMMDAGVKMHSY